MTTLARMRERGGLHEFIGTQRLGFDLMARIVRGTASHVVDFTEHRLGSGDMLWVGAGRVQQWGRIQDIDGPVVLFAPHAITERTRVLLERADASARSYWPGAGRADAPTAPAWDLLEQTGSMSAQVDSSDASRALSEAATAAALDALLLVLAATAPATGAPTDGPQHEVFRWFRAEIESRFTTMHKVAEYADRLGYSPRTLNRLAKSHTGLSAKQLIDERIVLEAKRLLTHEPEPVARVAQRLGFDDPSNFSAYFQHRTGQTPGAFRAG